MFNMYLTVSFSNDRLFPKIMKGFLFKYWLKTGPYEGINTAKDFDWLIALGKLSF